MKSVVGLFANESEAQAVVKDLEAAGIPGQNINLTRKEATAGATGAGGRTGSGGGMTFLKQLFGMDHDEAEAEYYEEGVRRGHTVVSCTVNENQVQPVVDVMNRHNVLDVDRRAQEWRQSGWTPGAAGGTRADSPKTHPRRAEGGEQSIPVTQEELRIGKREVQRGGVRVYTRTIEQPVEKNVTLHEEKVSVQRRPVDRAVKPGDERAFKDGVVEITATSEEAVVQKDARVVEEVVIRKDAKDRTETVRDTVRRTEVQVENVDDKRPAGKP